MTRSLVSFGAGFESVLDALRPLLPTSPLTWHYRSRDERLVAFSNAHIYGGALTTFPGVLRDDCLRHVVVAQGPEPGQEVSVTAEVDKVVELVLEHARTQPAESLGVIALGIKHAERIDAALRDALAAHPGLEGVLRRGHGRAVLREEPGAGAGRRAGRDHPVHRVRQAPGRPDALPVGPAAARRRRAPAERGRHPGQAPADPGQLVLQPRRGPGPGDQGGARLLADYLEYAGSGGTAAEASGRDRAEPVRGRRAGPAGRVRDHRGAAVRGGRLPGGLRRRPPGRHRPDGAGHRDRRCVLPSVGQRPGPGPAARRAPAAAGLELPPAVVHQLVPEPAGRGGQAAGRLSAGGRGHQPAAADPPAADPPPAEPPAAGPGATAPPATALPATRPPTAQPPAVREP